MMMIMVLTMTEDENDVDDDNNYHEYISSTIRWCELYMHKCVLQTEYSEMLVIEMY